MTYPRGRKSTDSLTIENYMAKLEKAASAPSPGLAAVMRQEHKASASVHLRNLSTLLAELRDVFYSGSEGVDMRELRDRLRGLEVSLLDTVAKAAQGAGLVALTN
jgi:hypothetical protein